MKRNSILKTIGAAGVALALAGGSVLAQQDADIKVKGDKVTIKSEEGKVTIKGPGSEELANKLLAPEIEATMVEGYVIPREYRTYFQPIPDPEPDVIVRYYNGRAYYVTPDTYRIVRVVPLTVRVR